MWKLWAGLLLCLVCLVSSLPRNGSAINLRRYNLRGQAGQAYSLEIFVGDPYQALRVIVDTGSSTLAIAAYKFSENDEYFRPNLSGTLFDSGRKVHAEYSQSNWVGTMASDFILFPDNVEIDYVRFDLALITEGKHFFINGSGWQGLLGLAYSPVGARGEDVIVDSWLTSLEYSKPLAFELKLCGPIDSYNAIHFGNFKLLNESSTFLNNLPFLHTPILKQRWYEIGVLGIRVLNKKNLNSDTVIPFDQEMCRNLNQEKSIVDSGTTNIRLPDKVFHQVIAEMRNEVNAELRKEECTPNPDDNFDDFWLYKVGLCWEAPKQWDNLPYLAIDLLSDIADDHYFTIEVPPQNYMRLVLASNITKNGIPQYCYELGIEAGGKETVLGYAAMEGFEVLFERNSLWIGWKSGVCGPSARVKGPCNASISLVDYCNLNPPYFSESILTAELTLLTFSTVGFIVIVYLMWPGIQRLLVKTMQRTRQMSQAEATLVEGT